MARKPLKSQSKLGEFMKENSQSQDILPCGCLRIRCKCKECHNNKPTSEHIRCCAEHKEQ